jgi:Isoleucyl-tRNA synthetase
MDKWILSGLNSLIKFVDDSLNDYKIFESSRKIQDFVDELSNWYVRRSRERYWGSEMTDDKVAAYMTLYTVLTELSKLIAPYTPFMAECIYQNLVRGFFPDAPESVHLAAFPTIDESYIKPDLEAGMDAVMKAVVLGRAARNKANIKNRQPLKTLILKGFKLDDEWKVLVEDELNVKEVVEAKSGEEDFVTYELKPQLKTIGPKYGKLLNKIREFLANAPGAEIVKAIEEGVFKTKIDDTEVEFAKDDVLVSVKNKEGYSSEVEGEYAAILDTTLTDELIAEGVEREIVSKIQTMRKEAGFEVVDHIVVGYKAMGLCKTVIENSKELSSDVLADAVKEEIDGYVKDWDVNGERLTLSVKKI